MSEKIVSLKKKGKSNPCPTITHKSSTAQMNRAASLSMTVTFDNIGTYCILPLLAYTGGSATGSNASMKIPDSCTFTGATVLSKNGGCYLLDVTSTSVTLVMTTGITASTSFRMSGNIFLVE